MSVNYYINTPEINLDDYKLEFKGNQYQWKVNAWFNLNGNFAFPPQTLKADFMFVNQNILNNELWYEKSCHSKNKNKCYVYKTTFNVNLSADKFFNQKFSNYQIPASFRLKLDNTQLKKVYAEQVNITDQIFNSFINNLSNSVHEFNFNFTNSYTIKQHNNINDYNLNLLTSWIVEKNATKYEYSSINVNFFNNNFVVNKPIKKFFEISSSNNKRIQIQKIDSYVDYYLNKNNTEKSLNINRDQHLLQSNFNSTQFNVSSWINTIFEKDELVISERNGVSGIFIPYKSQGSIKTEVLLIVENQGIYLTLINGFNFKLNFLIAAENDVSLSIKKQNWKINKISLNEYKEISF